VRLKKCSDAHSITLNISISSPYIQQTSPTNTSQNHKHYWIAFHWPSCTPKQITSSSVNLSKQILNN